ncbi:radical SAM/SPASM domain-containing protein [Fusibacillus kribbianus]|uniref:Radical SAM protein n=1 Tax=Fusibacillus kribbianus TaxID=3044208 RepID=A0AAP4B8T1_9FIRM|nr:radical SAM protein [Ruminococcus sp. YH-rum2234]MDI9241829.1 radical SAM protein [Ruminococcus sp. YH-rum2234]
MSSAESRKPLNGTFELTGRCNLSCRMCLIRVDRQKIQCLGSRERTAEEWIGMAEQAAKAGTLGLLLTGGEVLLRSDFCEIYEAIAQMGFLITVYTNATLVTDRVMELFRKYPPHKIGVTMYGASNNTYQKLCGCNDGYDRFTEGIERLSVLPSLFEIRTTIVKDNWCDLRAMQQFTKQKFGSDKPLQISRFVTKSIRGGIACAGQCRLTSEENAAMIYSGLAGLYQKVKNGEVRLPEPVEKFSFRQRRALPEYGCLFQHCGAGIDQYTITWDGSMYACELMPEGCTKPFAIGFQKAWEELPDCYPQSRSMKVCEECEYEPFCESCPAVRKAETGDFFGKPEYFCREAKCVYDMLKEMHVI